MSVCMYLSLYVCLYTCNNFIHAIINYLTSVTGYPCCGLNKLFYNELIYCRPGECYTFSCLPPQRSSLFFDSVA